MNKIEMTDIALRLAGFNYTKRGVDHVLQIIEAVEEKEENLTIEDIAKIEAEIKTKYEK